jgi:hypothetical protein
MAGQPLRVLLIQSWIVQDEVVRAPLRAAGFAAHVTRVDFEAALEAALCRGQIDIVIYDPATGGMPRGLVDGKLLEHGVAIPVVVLSDPDGLCDAVQKALVQPRN